MGPVALGPPDEGWLNGIHLPLIEVDLGAFMRVSEARYDTVVHFGKGARHRFDDPRRAYGVLYAGSDYLTCMSESLLRDEMRNSRTLYVEDVRAKVIARLAPGPVRVVDLTDALELGLDNQISTCPTYRITQEWSRALYEHPSAPDGLYFLSRNYPKGAAVALFDRVLERMQVAELPGSRVPVTHVPEYRGLLVRLQRAGIDLRTELPTDSVDKSSD